MIKPITAQVEPFPSINFNKVFLPSLLTKTEIMNEYFKTQEQVEKQLYRWHHKIHALKRIGDDGILRDRCKRIAKEMWDDPKHYLWEDIINWPTKLIR